MAHNLATKENGDYAFVGREPAWHGLGTVLNKAFTAEEALKQGGLDFDVIKIQKKLETGIVSPDDFALVRLDRANKEDGSGILGSCSKNYHIVQNEELFSFFDYLVDEGKAIYESAGVLGKGERVWIMAKLPEDIVIGDKDVIKQYILITNAHTGAHAAQALLTPVRVVCQNTLNMALKGTKNLVTIRHFSNAKVKLQEAHRVMGFSTIYYDKLKETYNRMKMKKVKDSEIVKYVNELFKVTSEDEDSISTKKKNQIQSVMDLYENGLGANWSKGTLWGFTNAVVEYADYYKVVRESGNASKRLNSIWFGDAQKLKQKAMDIALDVINKN